MISEKEINKNLGKGQDLRGRKFGKLTPLYPLAERRYSQVVWHCKCDCGNEKDIVATSLMKNATQSCGCLQKERVSKCNQKDLSNQIFGELTVLQKTEKRKFGSVVWLCECNCGNKVEVSARNLIQKTVQSCGCSQYKKVSKKLLDDLTGQRFGYLTVLKREENLVHPSGKIKTRWLCRCDCGRKIICNSDRLKSGEKFICNSHKLSKGENKITQILNKNNIKFETQKTFDTCRFPNTNALARFDFYLPDYDLLIEYDGEQHFFYKENGGWNNKENFIKTQEHDNYKDNWCKTNNVSLIRIPYTHLKELNINDLLLETTKYLIK